MFSVGMRAHDLKKQGFLSLVEAIKRNDIKNIQLAFSKAIDDIDFSLGNFNAGLANYIGTTLRENGIHVPVLGCYINPIEKNPIKRMEEVNKFKEHLLYAKYIGADMVGTETGNSPAHSEDDYKTLLESMREIVQTAEKLGVMVGVEGVFTHTLNNPKTIKRFLMDINSPNVSIIFDPVNMSGDIESQRKMMSEAMELYGERISVMHIKDFDVIDGIKREAPIGEGKFDYAYLFELLKAKKPYITMLLEASNEERYARDVAFLKDIYNRIG